MDNEIKYGTLLTELKQAISDARLKVSFTINEQLLELYWRIGNSILMRQNAEGWEQKLLIASEMTLKNLFLI